MDFTRIPLAVPQSISVMMTSWATSTSFRVMYPESAVLSAVSARPLRAPWVEMKYSSTDRPERKFEMMGRSMISPEGLAMRPRIPESCLICWRLPRAPESTIMKSGLGRLLPSLCSMVRKRALVISSPAWVQISTILL